MKSSTSKIASLILLSLPAPATATVIFTGQIFNDYNSNGVRDTNSAGFYEGTAPNVQVRLKSCDDATPDKVITSTFSNDDGDYVIEFSVVEGYTGCFYVSMDLGKYSVGPYVTSGEFSQFVTNQIYPESGKSNEVVISDGNVIVSNVGLVTKSASTTAAPVSDEGVSAVPEGYDNYSYGDDYNGDYSYTTTDATTTIGPTTPQTFVSFENNNVSVADVVDTQDAPTGPSGIVDGETSSSTIATGFAAVDETPAPSTESAASLFGGDDADSNPTKTVLPSFSPIEAPTSSIFLADGNQTATSSTEASETTQTALSGVSSSVAAAQSSSSSVSTIMGTASNSTSSNSTTTVTSTSSTSKATTTVLTTTKTSAAPNQDELNNTAVDEAEVGGGESSSSRPTLSPTKMNANDAADKSPAKDPAKNPSNQSQENTDSGMAAESDNNDSTEDMAKETDNNSKPTGAPTPKPTSCIGCELSLEATVRIQLDNIKSKLNDDARDLFENVCASFLKDQLSIATPPISR